MDKQKALPCFIKIQGLGGRYGERLVRVEATLKVFMEQVDKRFEQIITFLWILGGYIYHPHRCCDRVCLLG